MHTGDLFPPVLERIVEREPGDPLGLDPRHDLQVLDDTRVTLMLQPGILSLGVFPDDGEIHPVVSGRDPVQRFTDDDVGVNIERLTHGDVPRVVPVDRGIKDPLETDLVTFERLHGSLEFGLVAVGLARDVVLLPFDGDVERGEDLLDRVGDFGTDPVTGDQGDGVGTSVLGGDLFVGKKGWGMMDPGQRTRGRVVERTTRRGLRCLDQHR